MAGSGETPTPTVVSFLGLSFLQLESFDVRTFFSKVKKLS